VKLQTEIDCWVSHTGFFVYDAIVQWRDHIYKADLYRCSKANYLRGMLRLIECGIVDIRTKLSDLNDGWLTKTKAKIDSKKHWSISTKINRKNFLNSFQKFIKTALDTTVEPYPRHPNPEQIKYILSSVQEISLAKDLSPTELCNAMLELNERDAFVIWLMILTGQSVEKILDVRKEHLRYQKDGDDHTEFSVGGYLDFEGGSSYHVPGHLMDKIQCICKNTKTYLFETRQGKRIRRTQVMRNLKHAGYDIGLTFDLTPGILHGFVCGYMSTNNAIPVV